MGFTADDAKRVLQGATLRVTSSRVAVVQALGDAKHPLSHSEVVRRLGDADCDQATVYRNLVKLRDAGVATIASRAEGIDRYALALPDAPDHRDHPHFVCKSCGRVACLPEKLVSSMSLDGAWAESIRTATVQLRGTCPDCIRIEEETA